MRRSVTALGLCLVMLIPAVPGLAAGPPEGPVHLGLGDSQAFGFGATKPAQLGYAAVLSRWLRSVDCRDGNPAACPNLDLVNLAIPGATSTSLIANQLPDALALIADRNGDNNAGNDVAFITLTIGGNDIFNPVVSSCAGGVTPACVAVIATAFGQYQANLIQILEALRSAAPDARIVISTYDNPLGSCFLAPLEPLGDLVLEGGPGLTLGFNDLIEMVAAASDVEVADTYGRLDAGDWVGGQDCLHPNNSGYKKMAVVFREVID